ncbi:hypothetical protein TSUD_195680 [Trifolium subterraneum]|nr:hypothetical protein TSUD_195680 [Trifolium subterraneum]
MVIPKFETVFEVIHPTGCIIKFLAVYDQPNAFIQFNTLCSRYNHPVTQCTEIPAAMNLLLEHIHLFDGIAIDIRLAELNGYEFIRFVKAENIDRDRAVCVTYDCNDAAIVANLENHVNHIVGGKCYIVSLGTINEEPAPPTTPPRNIFRVTNVVTASEPSTSLVQVMNNVTAFAAAPIVLTQIGGAPQTQLDIPLETRVQVVPCDSIRVTTTRTHESDNAKDDSVSSSTRLLGSDSSPEKDTNDNKRKRPTNA